MAAIQKQSLVDQVYTRLRTDIITLQRPLGERLNVSETQAELGVSCTPIREAINRLQQEGLVVYENNVGARILTLDAHDITEIQQLAMTLHCAAIRLAMENGNRPAISNELERHLEAYKASRTVQSEVMAVHRLVGTFYRNCGNRRLDRSMVSIQGQQLLLRYIYATCTETRGANAADFERMLQAVSGGSAAAVCAALEQNAARA
ncbi:MAG: GntR family transcriptional regulator, partial [Pseudoflavonifractor sp.]